MVVFWIVAGWLACVLSALVAGLALLRLLRVSLGRMEAICLGFVAGSAVLSAVVFAVAALGIAYKGVFLGITAVALAAAVYWRRALLPHVFTPGERIAIGWKILFAAVLIGYGNLYLHQALAPEMSSDGMMYHLGLVSLFNRAHGFVRYVDMYAGLPEGVEMLFFYAFSIGRHSAASLVHMTYLVDLALLMVLYAKRFGFASAGVAAALVVFASPLVAVDGTCSYNDVALAAVTLAAVYLLRLWWNDRSTGLMMACALVTGFTMSVKYNAVLFAVFVLAVFAVGLPRKNWPRWAGTVLAAGCVMSVCVVPYLVRNAIWFQNPVAFFGNSVFRNPYFHISFEQGYAWNLSHLRGLEWHQMPLQVTLGGPNVEGCFGAIFLLAPVALISLFWREGRWLLLAVVPTLVAFPAARSPRYLIPALPLIAMAVMFVIRRVPWSHVILAALVLAHLVTSWPPHLDRWYKMPGWHVARVPWKVDMREVPEDQWLKEHSEEYAITRQIDAVVPKGEKVFSMACPGAKSYTEREIMVVFQSAGGEQLGDALYTTWDSARSARRRWRFRFPSTMTRELRLEQTGTTRGYELPQAAQEWSINELKLESNGAEVPVGMAGHPYAWPCPWDVARAFDGNGITRWKTWEPLRPGMHFGIRFDAPVKVDGLTILDFPDQYLGKMVLKVRDNSDRWSAAPPPALEVVPAVDLRKDATALLKQAGIHYILLSTGEWNSSAFLDAAPAWGLTPVTGTPNYKLFRID